MRRCIANCFDCFANHREPLLHMAKIFTKSVRALAPWNRSIRSETRWLGGSRAGGLQNSQCLDARVPNTYSTSPVPRMHSGRAGWQAGRLVEFFICLARAAPSTRLECAHGCWCRCGTAGRIKMQSRFLAGCWSGLSRSCSGCGPSCTGGFVGSCLNMVQIELN